MGEPGAKEHVPLGRTLVRPEPAAKPFIEVRHQAAERVEVALHPLPEACVQPAQQPSIAFETPLHGVGGGTVPEKREAAKRHASMHGLLLPMRAEQSVEARVTVGRIPLAAPVVLLGKEAHVDGEERHRERLFTEHVCRLLELAGRTRQRRAEARLHGRPEAVEEREVLGLSLRDAEHRPEVFGVVEECRRRVAEERRQHGPLQEAEHLEIAVRAQMIQRAHGAWVPLEHVRVGVNERGGKKGTPHVQQLDPGGDVLEVPAHPVGCRDDGRERRDHRPRIAPAERGRGMV